MGKVRTYDRVLSYKELVYLYNEGLVAYYPMDESTGTQLIDHSGNNHTGSIVNGAWVEGYEGNALYLNRSGYAEIPMTVDCHKLTISLWFEAEDFSTNAKLIVNSHTDVDKKRFQIVIERGGNELFADTSIGGSEGVVSIYYPFEKGK